MPRNTAGQSSLTAPLKVQDFEEGLASQAFYLLYQPRLDLRTQKMSGLEVLIRWHHPEQGVLLPPAFLPLAEQTGFILKLDAWVLKTACAQHQCWQQEGYRLPLAINLSPKQLEAPGFVGQLRSILAEHKLEASLVELDLQESLFDKAHAASLGSVISELQHLGVGLCIDNFGLAKLSAEDLQGLPIHSLKMDQSFVEGLPGATDLAQRVQQIIQLGRTLNTKVVAKGIESKMQFQTLQSFGVDEIQGFYYSRPLSVSSFPEMFKRLERFSDMPL